jgi:hypothetical protein
MWLDDVEYDLRRTGRKVVEERQLIGQNIYLNLYVRVADVKFIKPLKGATDINVWEPLICIILHVLCQSPNLNCGSEFGHPWFRRITWPALSSGLESLCEISGSHGGEY